MSKGSSQTIGFHYIMTMLIGLWRGPINELLAIEGDDKIAWQGNAADATPQIVNSPNLFGGEKEEGGIQGAFILLQGDPAQVLPGATAVGGIGTTGPVQSTVIPNIKASIGGRVSDFRGFVSLLFHGLICSMNPYPKEWHLFGWRTTAGWFNNDCWYPAKATIVVGSSSISAGQDVKLSWYQATVDEGTNDQAHMGMAFLDSVGGIIGSISWSTMTNTAPGTWTLRTLEETAPAGAVHIRLYMEMNRRSGTNNDGCIDAIELAVNGTDVAVVNPGGQDGTFGWLNEVGAIGNGPVAGGSGQPTAYEGSAYFNGGTSSLSRAYQDIGIGSIKAMNPAHIIYQTLTDPEWGSGRSTSDIDDNSFVLAANTLCSEGFGLCINWSRQEDVDTFLQSVIDHISAALYTDRSTGKIVLKLIRGDYDPTTLPLYDFNSGLLEVSEDDNGSSDEMINEIIVQGKDQTLDGRGMDFEVRVHNNSARQAQGAISDTMSLPGIPTRDLAARRGQMELATHAPGLKRFSLKFDRRAWQLTPAAVIRISAPENNISNMIVRLGDDIAYGNTSDGTITVSAIEDVFGMPAVSFQSGGGSTWVAPGSTPVPAAATDLIEAGYRDLVRRIGSSQTDALDPTSGYIGQLAKSASGAYRYDLLSRVSGEPTFVDRATGSFTEETTLSADVAEMDTAIVVADASQFASHVDEALLCENEVMRLDAVDVGTNTLTVARGCCDTVPAPHASAAAIWLLDDDLIADAREYSSSEVVETKVLTRTSSGVLDEAAASTDSVTIAARQFKPYPPGDVQVDGTSIFALTGYHPAPVVTWTHRDRLSENDTLVEHGASSVGPEVGTTYNIRVKPDGGGTPLRTVTALSGTTWTYDGTMQATDGSPDTVLMELESERDSVTSWQMYSFTVPLAVPAPPTPRVSIDFKNAVYSIGGTTETLADVVEHNALVGPYSSGDVAAGVGLERSTSGYTMPALTSAAFDAATAGGVGCSVVLTVALTGTPSAYAKALVSFAPDDESTAYEGFVKSFDSDNTASVYDYDSQEQDIDVGSTTIHKVGFQFAPGGLSVCVDGGAVELTGTPQTNAATMIYLQAQSGGSGATAVIEKAEFFAPVGGTTLQSLTT